MPADAKINRKSNKNPFRTVTKIFGLIEADITFQDFLLKSWHLLIFRHAIHAGILEISLLTGLITQISDQVHWKFKMCKHCVNLKMSPQTFGLIEAAITFQDFLLKSWHLLIFRYVRYEEIFLETHFDSSNPNFLETRFWFFFLETRFGTGFVTFSLWFLRSFWHFRKVLMMRYRARIPSDFRFGML